MTEQRQYDGGADTAHSSPVQQSGRSETPADASATAGHSGPEAVAGPFTLRETVIGVSVLVMFVGTILPFMDGVNLWRTFSLFFLGIGILLPVAALSLIVGRRLGAKSLRVGSLSVDQFASVTAAFAAAFFFLQTVTTFEVGAFIALLGSVGFFVATVGGPHLGVFKPDFAGRPSSSAHRIAREALPAKPRPPKPVPAETVTGWNDSSAGKSVTGGPSSAGYSAGYAVVDYAAGQGSGASHGSAAGQAQTPVTEHAQVPAAKQDSAPHTESTARPTETREAEPAAPSAGAAQPEAPRGSGSHAVSSSGAAAEAAAPAATVAQPAVEKAAERTMAQQTVRQTDSSTEEAAHPRTESISATRDAEDDEPVLEAFWFAVGTPRSVVDEQTGAPLFVLQPGDWEVGIEDRGHEFLVQDKRTGRIGVMRDLRNIERAPREG
ncbi:hypothetical protein [Arthrobacter sp. D2-10]